VGWSGPATLKLVGDKDQTEAIAIEAVSQPVFHSTKNVKFFSINF